MPKRVDPNYAALLSEQYDSQRRHSGGIQITDGEDYPEIETNIAIPRGTDVSRRRHEDAV